MGGHALHNKVVREERVACWVVEHIDGAAPVQNRLVAAAVAAAQHHSAIAAIKRQPGLKRQQVPGPQVNVG